MDKMMTPLDKHLITSRSKKAEERRAAKAKHNDGQVLFDKLKELLDGSDLPECVDLEITAPDFPEDPLELASYGMFRLSIHGESTYMHVYAYDDNYEVSMGWNRAGSKGDKLTLDKVVEKLAAFIADNEPPQS